mmetsp:Transcript_59280/g.150084  ORF Transcript_59280/g.150084 Transcript_59280/m.150084 type:complete len:225 (-) Transcript_59280:517-1191(-)
MSPSDSAHSPWILTSSANTPCCASKATECSMASWTLSWMPLSTSSNSRSCSGSIPSMATLSVMLFAFRSLASACSTSASDSRFKRASSSAASAAAASSAPRSSASKPQTDLAGRGARRARWRRASSSFSGRSRSRIITATTLRARLPRHRAWILVAAHCLRTRSSSVRCCFIASSCSRCALRRLSCASCSCCSRRPRAKDNVAAASLPQLPPASTAATAAASSA